MQSLALLLLVVVLAVCGCSSVGQPAPAAPPAPAAAPADQRAAVPAALAVERQWLQSWFQGTPVLIGQGDDGALSVDVPREFCFDPGRSSVKPALAAVLNKVAESLRRVPQRVVEGLRIVVHALAPTSARGAWALGSQMVAQRPVLRHRTRSRRAVGDALRG
jgi:outer membrane protein OmpA-like peptidoglycan-associated protein